MERLQLDKERAEDEAADARDALQEVPFSQFSLKTIVLHEFQTICESCLVFSFFSHLLIIFSLLLRGVGKVQNGMN